MKSLLVIVTLISSSVVFGDKLKKRWDELDDKQKWSAQLEEIRKHGYSFTPDKKDGKLTLCQFSFQEDNGSLKTMRITVEKRSRYDGGRGYYDGIDYLVYESQVDGSWVKLPYSVGRFHAESKAEVSAIRIRRPLDSETASKRWEQAVQKIPIGVAEGNFSEAFPRRVVKGDIVYTPSFFQDTYLLNNCKVSVTTIGVEVNPREKFPRTPTTKLTNKKILFKEPILFQIPVSSGGPRVESILQVSDAIKYFRLPQVRTKIIEPSVESNIQVDAGAAKAE